MKKKIHTNFPLHSKVYQCANCGAVSLTSNNLCKVQGLIEKADFCGTKSVQSPKQCFNKKNTDRYVCTKCNRVAMNEEILCQPEKMEKE